MPRPALALLVAAALPAAGLVPLPAASPALASATPASATSAAVVPPVGETTVEQVPLAVLPEVDAEPPAGPGPEGPALEAADPVDPAGGVVAGTLDADGLLVTPPVDLAGAQTVGVGWPEGVDGAALAPRVRALADGQWSDWWALEAADAAPYPGTADAARAAGAATDPLWVGAADAVQLAFAAPGGDPADLTLALVGSPLTEPEGAGVVEQTSATPAGARSAPVPAVVSRAQWGARPQACALDVAPRVDGAVVHHTAGGNAYSTQAQAMQQIRNDQAYHLDVQGWCDLGYNVVVDKGGTVYEGRAGSLTRAVVGVHASGANTGTVGVSMLGNYETAPTTPAMVDAVGRIIGARLGAYGVDPLGTWRYPVGRDLPRVIGHRDVSATLCPGRYGYAQLGTIRAAAAAAARPDAMPAAQAEAIVRALYEDLLGRAPDPGGLDTWTRALRSGTGQPALVGSLTASEEYVRLRVRQAYVEALGRQPEASGLQYWRDRVVGGHATVDDVKRRFYDSQEFADRAGGSAGAYVDLLYRTMFERSASAGERAHWSARIATVGRSRVVDEIWFSTEAAMWRSGRYYETFLRRSAEWSGRVYWAQILQARGEGAVRQGIAGSTEYRNLALRRFPG